MYPPPALLTPLPLVPFTTEEITGCTNEAAKGANKAERNPPPYFFISCFTFSVIPSMNTFKSSNEFMILIISFKFLFKINKVNLLPALAVIFSLMFLSNLFIAFEDKFLTNPGKLSLNSNIFSTLSP